MKAITINGTVQIYNSIPRVWNGIHNYNSVNNTTKQYADGWRDLAKPAYDEATQSLGAVYFDEPNDRFTYNVVDKTAEEQAEYVQQQEDADSASLTHKDHKSNGVRAFDRAIALVFRKYQNGDITGAQAKAVTQSLYPLIEPLYKGIWQLAKANLAGATPPSNATLLNIFNTIKNKIDQYVDENY